MRNTHKDVPVTSHMHSREVQRTSFFPAKGFFFNQEFRKMLEFVRAIKRPICVNAGRLGTTPLTGSLGVL